MNNGPPIAAAARVPASASSAAPNLDNGASVGVALEVTSPAAWDTNIRVAGSPASSVAEVGSASDVVIAVVVVVDVVSAVVVSVVVSSCDVVSVVNDVDEVVADVDEVDVVVADVDIVVVDTDVAEDSKTSGVDVVQSLIALTTWRRACSNELPLPSS